MWLVGAVHVGNVQMSSTTEVSVRTPVELNNKIYIDTITDKLDHFNTATKL